MTLIPRSGPLAWRSAPLAKKIAGSLAALGFEGAGYFETEEFPGLRIQAWIKPDEAVTAVIFEMPMASLALDVVTDYEDGTSVTFTTNAATTGRPPRPGHTNVRVPGADAETLYRRLLAERPEGAMVRPTVEGFPAQFERDFADTTDWGNARGGSTPAEIRAATPNQKLSDEVVENMRRKLQKQAQAGLTAGLLERYFDQNGIARAERKKLRKQFMVIHDRITSEEVVNLLGVRGPDRNPISARETFTKLNELLPAARRWHKVAELSWPVAADVYRRR